MDLIKLAQGYLSDEILDTVSSQLGEGSDAARKGFGAALPSLMAGVISKGSDSGGASDLFNLVTKPELGGGLLANLGGLFGGARSEAQEGLTSSILNMLFGDKMDGVVGTIARVAGLKSGSASSIMKMAAPFLMSIIGKQVKSQGLNVTGFAEMLMGQKDHLKAHAPSGLLDSLGGVLNLGSALGVGKKIIGGAESVAGSAGRLAGSTAGTVSKAKRPNWLWPLLGVILLAMLGYYLLRGCNNGNDLMDVTKETIEDVGDAAGEMASEGSVVSGAVGSVFQAGEALIGKTVEGYERLGAFMKRKLSTGVELIIPEKGVEAQLLDFIESSSPVRNDLWFNFDRILFETGSATLKAESGGQISNIARIMNAFPNVHLKIGGYTDNTGNPASNLALSTERAKAVAAAVVAAGISSSRLASEGYGDQHPVASNDTEEGRAMNRRVAARVTQK
jgi:outer membrane protein OmpA-like peptidoglycan-associated protein